MENNIVIIHSREETSYVYGFKTIVDNKSLLYVFIRAFISRKIVRSINFACSPERLRGLSASYAH